MDNFFTSTGAELLRYLPDVIVWPAGITAAVVMLRRGGGRAEKLFLAGVILLFTVNLSSPLISRTLIPWLSETADISAVQIGLIVSVPRAALSLAGFICLVWAFWLRFGQKKEGMPVE